MTAHDLQIIFAVLTIGYVVGTIVGFGVGRVLQ